MYALRVLTQRYATPTVVRAVLTPRPPQPVGRPGGAANLQEAG